MSELLQFIIVIAFGALCFGCGCLTAFIVTRNRWRDEMIKRGVARYNWTTGKWEWGEPPKESWPPVAFRRPGPSRNVSVSLILHFLRGVLFQPIVYQGDPMTILPFISTLIG